MDQGDIQGMGTVLTLIAFLGISWWAFSKHKKKDFEEASRLPFDDDELLDGGKTSANSTKRHN